MIYNIIALLLTLMFFVFEIIASIQDIKTMKIKNYCHIIPMAILFVCLFSLLLMQKYTLLDVFCFVGLVLFCIATRKMRGGADTDSMILFIMYIFSLYGLIIETDIENIALTVLLAFLISCVIQFIYQVIYYEFDFSYVFNKKKHHPLAYMPALCASYFVSIIIMFNYLI